MKRILIIVLVLLGFGLASTAQIDRDQLSLDISKAEAANLEQMKAYLWKRVAITTVDGVKKLTTEADMKFDEEGKLDVKMIDADTDVKQKRGIRGKMQANAAKENMEYVEQALELAIAYTYMTKGQLIDFFGKADITEKDGIITASAGNVLMKGDSVTLLIHKSTKLFTHKTFSSFVGEDKDPMNAEVTYAKFKSGVSHATGSVLTLPAKKAVITAKNQDYSKRVE